MINVFSSQIASDASLTITRCQISILEDLGLAGDELSGAALGSAFFGLDGDVFFVDSHLFVPLTVRFPF